MYCTMGDSDALALVDATPTAQPEPFAREAKFLSESKALGRDVRIMLEGVDKFGNLFGQVCALALCQACMVIVLAS